MLFFRFHLSVFSYPSALRAPPLSQGRKVDGGMSISQFSVFRFDWTER